jgi:4-diphosphocytidyl-2-C-methyl-D-erythritol kinase
MSKRLRVVCPAKINLSLEVLGRRPDGYHELRTVFQAVSLADELVLEQSGGPALTVQGVLVPVDDNLCLQAVREFRQQYEVPDPLSMHLNKMIPAGAGLGGGSSDAAGTLAGLAAWHGAVPPEKLRAMGARLGSDVAFFLEGGTALGQGRGEVLTSLPAPEPSWLVIARPDLQVSTAEAYQALCPEDFTGGEQTEALVAAMGAGYGLRHLAGHLYNAFTRAVVDLYPPIGAAHSAFVQAGAQAALLCGSGAAVFGLFVDEPAAREAEAAVRREGLWAAAAVTIGLGVQVIGER